MDEDAFNTYAIPAIEDYSRLIPVARELYEKTSHISWLLIVPLFCLSIAFAYSNDLGIAGAVLVRLKRLILVALLLAAFPTIAETLQTVGVEIARSIDNMNGIDQVLEAAQKRADTFSFDLEGLLNMGSDLLVGSLVLLSFIILVFARLFLLSFQHFYWFLFVALGPFLILGALFDSTVGMTKGLFKSMTQVACWPIIWSVLSAFLRALPFASAYTSQESLVTVVTLNLIIAVALLFSPFIISQLAEGVNLSVGDTLRRGVLKTVMMMNPKTAAASVLKTGAKANEFASKAARFSKGGK